MTNINAFRHFVQHSPIYDYVKVKAPGAGPYMTLGVNSFEQT